MHGTQYHLTMLQSKAVGMKSAIERMVQNERLNTPPSTYIENYNNMIAAVSQHAPNMTQMLPPTVEGEEVTYYQIMSYCAELNEMLSTYLKEAQRDDNDK